MTPEKHIILYSFIFYFKPNFKLGINMKTVLFLGHPLTLIPGFTTIYIKISKNCKSTKMYEYIFSDSVFIYPAVNLGIWVKV